MKDPKDMKKDELVKLVDQLKEQLAAAEAANRSEAEDALQQRVNDLEAELAQADVPGLKALVAELSSQLNAQEKKPARNGTIGTSKKGVSVMILAGCVIDGTPYTREQIADRPDLIQHLLDNGSALAQPL